MKPVIVRGLLDDEVLSAGQAKKKHGLTYSETMIRDWMLTEGADRSKPALVAYCETRIAEGRKSATKAARASHYAAQRHFAKGSKR